MKVKDLIALIEPEGYYDLREIEGRGLCGLMRFVFTIGLVYGISEYGYVGRYCYKHNADAKLALEQWNGEGDPKDAEWIKHKGRSEYSNTFDDENNTGGP